MTEISETSKKVCQAIGYLYQNTGKGLPCDNLDAIIPHYKKIFNEDITSEKVFIAVKELLSNDLISEIIFIIDLNTNQKFRSESFYKENDAKN